MIATRLFGLFPLPGWLHCVAISALVLGLSLPSSAALGGNVESVAADQAGLRGRLKVAAADVYSVYEIKAPSGTVVREYVTMAGQVFGIAWQGPFMPDLQQILGMYFQRYSAAVQEAKASYVGRRPLNLQQPGLVIQTGGHMRAYVGRAYLPELLPRGISADAIR